MKVGLGAEPLVVVLGGLSFGEATPLLLVMDCVRSKIWSFLSRLPVATQVGEACCGKATDLTMCVCWRVCRHSPVCGSHILLGAVSKTSDGH
jgi:hypothetical protein